jgi:hypothetical protein
MSPDEARQLLAEYLEVLAREKDDLYRDGGLENPAYRATLRLWGRVYKLGADSVFTDEKFVWTTSELRRRAAAGEAPRLVVRAFIVAHRDLRKRRRETERRVRNRLRTVPPDRLRFEMTRQTAGRLYYPLIVRESVNAVLAESAVVAPVAMRSPRPRESRPRACRSSSRGSPSRLADDDPEPPLGRVAG